MELFDENVPNIDFENMTWEFKNVLQQTRYSEPSKYVVNIDLFTLGMAYKNGLIYYLSSVQRGSKLDRNQNEIPIFRAKKVKEIMNAIEMNDWHGGCLIANTDTDNIKYDPDTLTLKGKGKLFIVDGHHRLLAAKRLTEKFLKGTGTFDPRNYQIACIIDTTTEEGAAKIFAEHSLLNWKPPKSRGEFLQVDKLENIITRRIMRESELRGKIETNTNQARGNNVCTFNAISNSISNHMKDIKTKEQANAVTPKLIDYINIIVNIFPDVLGNVDAEARKKNREKTFAGEQIFIEAYIASFLSLVDKEDMVDKLKTLKNKVSVGKWTGEFLSRENPIFINNITIQGKIVNKRSTQKFVADVIKEYLTTGKVPEINV